VEKCGTAGQATHGRIIGRMRFECWIKKAHTHPEHVLLCFFHANEGYMNGRMLHYTYVACLVLLSKWHTGVRYTCECNVTGTCKKVRPSLL